jgi:hypothetical protein
MHHKPVLQAAPSVAYAVHQIPNAPLMTARKHISQPESQAQRMSLGGATGKSNLYQASQVSKPQTLESQRQHPILPPQGSFTHRDPILPPQGSFTHRDPQLASSSIRSQTLGPEKRMVMTLDKSTLDACHPSNLSNKSNSSAGTCGSDIGYASTTSSEHVNDAGGLSDTTSSSNDMRRVVKDFNFKQRNVVADSLRRPIEAQKRRPCRSVSPTPSPKESAVPVPTRLCAKITQSPRGASPEMFNRPMLEMPGANKMQTWTAQIQWKTTQDPEEEDAVGRPEQLDKMYGCNQHMSEVPGTTAEEEQRAAQVSDALREAELAREFAMAALGRCKRTCSTVQASGNTPGSQIGSATVPTPRWSIPSIWDSGEVHSDLLSWFADELGVSKDATADISAGLMQSYSDRPLTSRSTAGSPMKQSTHSDSSPDFSSDYCSPLSTYTTCSPRKHVRMPHSPPTSNSEAVVLDDTPFQSVLAAPLPLLTSLEDEDGFAPEPRMLVNPPAHHA